MKSRKEQVAVPNVLKAFEAELVEAQREYVSIEAEPLDCKRTDDPLKLTQSKFLGLPFFPSGGVLQLFFPADEWWDMGSEKVIYHSEEDLKKTPIFDFSFIDAGLYDELPVSSIHKLSFKKAIDTGCSEDSQFSIMFGTKDYWDFEDDLNEEEQKEFDEYFSSTGHKIGGYGDFTQSDPRDYRPNQKNDIQLLQIDVDDYIMFGDSSVGHLFIRLGDLEARKFENAWFYWDCC
ncbi:DUF1963 domain-containing protein [Litoribrevibacter albus]|uniref:DUF1963 domain-containing protein n=1 Tax=Litoribrevibacter albus TaxID=1473156 RepID=A0AA37W8G6_9GAMM|nr:DUF1963 domain-containing protein [Litoribrevibacter albus]GLQ31994.1 hypothetical protein GCM10007876_24730 [Litoribrevibacter albus]